MYQSNSLAYFPIADYFNLNVSCLSGAKNFKNKKCGTNRKQIFNTLNVTPTARLILITIVRENGSKYFITNAL